jgi:putative peptidoglycan lipid II flippase
MSDSTKSIARSARRFFSGTMLSRLTGMLRDMSMAYVFGTHPAIAAFMLAFRLSHLLRRLFGEGALQSAFIPEFEHLRHSHSENAFKFFRDLSVGLSLFLIGIIGLGCAGLFLILHLIPLSADNRDVIFLTLIMLPSLLFICLYGFNSSLLQCERVFFIPSAAPVAFNIIWILIVLSLKQEETGRAVTQLAYSITLATFAQWLMTVPSTLRILKKNITFEIYEKLSLYSKEIQKLLNPLFLGIVGVAATQVNNAVDSLFAWYAQEEGPALLWYAIRIQQLPLALFGIAIAGAILPPLSRAIKASDQEKYSYFLRYALQHTVTLMLPLTAFLLIAGDSCINFIYGRGDFTAYSILGTTECLWAYAAGLLPSSLVLILAPACYAQQHYTTPAYASLLSMISNFILNFILIGLFKWGAASVALATSLSAWFNLFFLGRTLNQRNHIQLFSILRLHSIKIGIATLIASIATALLRLKLQLPFYLLTNLEPLFSRNFIQQTKEVAGLIVCFGMTFYLAIYLLKTSIFNMNLKTKEERANL